jgi:hypothetical protein
LIYWLTDFFRPRYDQAGREKKEEISSQLTFNLYPTNDYVDQDLPLLAAPKTLNLHDL